MQTENLNDKELLTTVIKDSYTKPELKIYGTVAALTASGGSTSNEGKPGQDKGSMAN